MPARVILQDFTGVPAIVDLAVMRDAMADMGGDPSRVNPLVPADLVIDHSVQVDRFGRPALRLQRRARVRAQRRALPAPALGADGVPRPARRAAGHGHRPPGQPRVPRARSSRTADVDGAPDRLSRTRSSGPTRARRWSTGSACSGMASAASRRRPCSSASRSTSRCRGSSASGCKASCRAARRQRTSCSS